jgi:hypothetical protein
MEITNIATTVLLDNYETSVCEIVIADGGTQEITLVALELSPADFITYSNYISLYMEKSSIRITNSDEQFVVTRMTSFPITEEVVEFDYASLSTLDQDILHAFYNMVLSLR